MSQEAYGNPYEVAANASVADRASFIRKTYAHLAGAILALIAIEAFFFNSPVAGMLNNLVGRGGMGWLAVMGVFMVVSWLASTFAASPQNKGLQYFGLGIYVLAYAILFVPVLSMAMSMTGDTSIIQKAGICTGAVFGALTMVAFFTRADFSFLRSFLMIGGFVALGAIVCGILFQFNLGVWFSAAMVLLASVSILYNTSNIIHEYSTTQHVAAALSLFGSVAMLFWYILRIFMSRE